LQHLIVKKNVLVNNGKVIKKDEQRDF
jgi:hypothetical protein